MSVQKMSVICQPDDTNQQPMNINNALTACTKMRADANCLVVTELLYEAIPSVLRGHNCRYQHIDEILDLYQRSKFRLNNTHIYIYKD
jgi:hypothetical protein